MEQIYRIGIDHGYGNIKTAHHIFESGVMMAIFPHLCYTITNIRKGEVSDACKGR